MGLKTPWTKEQVDSFNKQQNDGEHHPYTCKNGRNKYHLDGEGVLVATTEGWVCPYCDYKQNWA
jgi:hypothetical protein